MLTPPGQRRPPLMMDKPRARRRTMHRQDQPGSGLALPTQGPGFWPDGRLSEVAAGAHGAGCAPASMHAVRGTRILHAATTLARYSMGVSVGFGGGCACSVHAGATPRAVAPWLLAGLAFLRRRRLRASRQRRASGARTQRVRAWRSNRHALDDTPDASYCSFPCARGLDSFSRLSWPAEGIPRRPGLHPTPALGSQRRTLRW